MKSKELCFEIQNEISQWRSGLIKGYGNAIVPQVINEIFKAIETIENKESE